jgi:hypothetical protein
VTKTTAATAGRAPQRAVRARAQAKSTRPSRPLRTRRATTTAPAQKTAASKRAPVHETVEPPLPHGFLSGATLAPTVQKLPFAALALVGLAIVLLALGALPAAAVPHPAAASLLATRRTEVAIAGLATLAAAIAAYLLV